MSTPEDTAKRKQQEGWNDRHPWHWREEVCFALVAGEVAGEVAGGKGEMLMRVLQQQAGKFSGSMCLDVRRHGFPPEH